MAGKSWFKYTDESGKCWRIQTTTVLAEIGGLQPADSVAVEPLPAYIKPRYIWLQEFPRPADRLSARQKVILERDYLKRIWGGRVDFDMAGKKMRPWSYYGEVMSVQ
jgi:hypothetical protein